MGWINEIVGICMAAHFNWALREDREKESEREGEKKKGDEVGSGGRVKQRGWNTHTDTDMDTHMHTHTFLQKASRLQLPSYNLQLTFLNIVCEWSGCVCVRVCDCAGIFLLTSVHACACAPSFAPLHLLLLSRKSILPNPTPPPII